jgi:transposase
MQFKYYLGIDVAKHRHQGAIVDAEGNLVLRGVSFPNTWDGFQRLKSITARLGPPSQFLSGMESTGHYWLNLYYALKEHGFHAVVINPLTTAHISQGHIRKTKTDRVDAVVIANQLRVGHYKPAIVPDEYAFRLRQLTRLRWKLATLACNLKNRIVGCVDRYFPEYQTVFKPLWLASSRRLLEVAPLPGDILSMGRGELAELLRSASHGRFSQDKADQVSNLAQASFGLQLAPDAGRIEMRCLMTLLSQIEQHMQALEDQAKTLLAQRPQFLTTIIGIKELTAATIIGEIGDIRYFQSPKELVAFAGLDPSTFQTGSFTGTRGRISKRGNAYLRRSLWVAALVASISNPALRPYYLRLRRAGKHHLHAVTATARKLTHIVWRILKDNRPFDPTRTA